MFKRRRRYVRLETVAALMYLSVVVGMLSMTTSCATAPPNLSPQGVIDFQTVQLGKDLDLIRDVAQEASKVTPTPLLSREIAVKVTLWHKAAVTALAARTPNWKQTISTGLEELIKPLSQKDKDILLPYVTLIRSVLAAL